MKIISVFLFCCCIISCATLPKQFHRAGETIVSGPGPEDMVVDTISEKPRLLISCNARRTNEPYYGEINIYYPATGAMKVMHRQEPKSILFYPHGIDLVRVKDTLVLLVVNNAPNHRNSILRYRVLKDELIFLNEIIDPLVTSPNAVTGFNDGTLLISNDMGKPGHFVEALFLLKRAQIIFYDGKKCSVAAGKFCYSNGITNKDNHVYLASTRQNKIWQFDFQNGKMINQKEIARVHGADNIRIDGNNLLVACHLRFLDFLKHMKDSSHYSPTTVYRINPSTKKTEVVYFDNGSQISAASTGLEFEHSLYISGVFDPKIVRVREDKK